MSLGQKMFGSNIGKITFLCSLNVDIGKQLDAFERKLRRFFLRGPSRCVPVHVCVYKRRNNVTFYTQIAS